MTQKTFTIIYSRFETYCNIFMLLTSLYGMGIILTKNGEGDLVVMDIETYNRCEKMLKLREELLAVEEDKIAGRSGCTLDELDAYLDEVIAEV